MAVDVGLEPDGEIGHNVVGSHEDAASTTEGRSPSALSAIPEGDESDFSGYIQKVMLAAWQEVENADDLTSEFMKDGCEEHQQQVYAAIEHAAAGMGRRPS
eukprot:649574-Pyramimonas_sp.AAC.1